LGSVVTFREGSDHHLTYFRRRRRARPAVDSSKSLRATIFSVASQRSSCRVAMNS
jgi:hypothetical protein